MKKLLVIISVAALVAGCKTNQNENTGAPGTEGGMNTSGANYAPSGSSTSAGGTTGGTGAGAIPSGTYNTSPNLNTPGSSGTSNPQP